MSGGNLSPHSQKLFETLRRKSEGNLDAKSLGERTLSTRPFGTPEEIVILKQFYLDRHAGSPKKDARTGGFTRPVSWSQMAAPHRYVGGNGPDAGLLLLVHCKVCVVVLCARVCVREYVCVCAHVCVRVRVFACVCCGGGGVVGCG